MLNVRNNSKKGDKNKNNNNNNGNTIYETIVIGDAHCGKSTYLSRLVQCERQAKRPIRVSDDQNEFEFLVANKTETDRCVFRVRDTANQERFRSLTQTYYRNAQCVLLMFDTQSEESFLNLAKWHADVMNYCTSQTDRFAVVLVGLKNRNLKRTSMTSSFMSGSAFSLAHELVEKFQQEKQFVIGHCEIDLADDRNLKEPFAVLFEYYGKLAESRAMSAPNFSKAHFINATASGEEDKAATDEAAGRRGGRENKEHEPVNQTAESTEKCCTIL